jgi:chromosome segregation ATPase
VAARNAIVKRLKSEGDRALASEIAGLRRPSWTDWALDMAAVAHTDITAAFADAAADMRDAQQAAASGRSGVNLRGSIAELRDRSAALVRAANEVLVAHGRPAALPDLTERVAAVAASATASERLRSGLLGPVDDAGDAGNGFRSAGAELAESDTRRPTARRKAEPRKDRPADQDDSKRRAGERRRLERDVKELERTLSSTERQVARAETAARHAQSAVDAAAEKVAEATAALQQAQQRAADMANERDELSRLAEETAADLEDARRLLDSPGD